MENWRKPWNNWRTLWKNWRKPWKTCRKPLENHGKIEENPGKIEETNGKIEEHHGKLAENNGKLKKTMENWRKPWNNWRKLWKHWRKPWKNWRKPWKNWRGTNPKKKSKTVKKIYQKQFCTQKKLLKKSHRKAVERLQVQVSHVFRRPGWQLQLQTRCTHRHLRKLLREKMMRARNYSMQPAISHINFISLTGFKPYIAPWV